MSKLWRYKLHRVFFLAAPELHGIDFTSEWLNIKDSIVVISKDYAWDGCSPTRRIKLTKILPNGLWFGPWDGPLTIYGRPSTWEASLVHDALCQYRRHIPGLTKQATVTLFKRLLITYGSPLWLANLYAGTVNHFGPQKWLGDYRVSFMAQQK